MRFSSNLHLRNKHKVKNDPLISMFCEWMDDSLKKKQNRNYSGEKRRLGWEDHSFFGMIWGVWDVSLG